MTARKPAKSLSDLLDSKSKEETPIESPEVETVDDGDSDLDRPETYDDEDLVDENKPVEQNPNGVNFTGSGNVIDKTPAELSAESPEETAQRFGISDEIPDDVANDPNVQVYADDQNYQIPGGTHVHPDIAKDNYNRAVGSPNNSVATTRTVTENVYATEAEQDDKSRKDVFDRDEDYVDDEN